jgi:hypothetical protein
MASGPADADAFRRWAMDDGSSTLLHRCQNVDRGCAGDDCSEQNDDKRLQNADDSGAGGCLLRVHRHAEQCVLMVCNHHHHTTSSLM